MKEFKSIFASKTFIMNLIVGLLAAATLINPSLLTALGIAPKSETKVLAVLALVVGVLNIVLRSLNGAPVSLTPTAANAEVSKAENLKG